MKVSTLLAAPFLVTLAQASLYNNFMDGNDLSRREVSDSDAAQVAGIVEKRDESSQQGGADIPGIIVINDGPAMLPKDDKEKDKSDKKEDAPKPSHHKPFIGHAPTMMRPGMMGDGEGVKLGLPNLPPGFEVINGPDGPKTPRRPPFPGNTKGKMPGGYPGGQRRHPGMPYYENEDDDYPRPRRGIPRRPRYDSDSDCESDYDSPRRRGPRRRPRYDSEDEDYDYPRRGRHTRHEYNSDDEDYHPRHRWGHGGHRHIWRHHHHHGPGRHMMHDFDDHERGRSRVRVPRFRFDDYDENYHPRHRWSHGGHRHSHDHGHGHGYWRGHHNRHPAHFRHSEWDGPMMHHHNNHQHHHQFQHMGNTHNGDGWLNFPKPGLLVPPKANQKHESPFLDNHHPKNDEHPKSDEKPDSKGDGIKARSAEPWNQWDHAHPRPLVPGVGVGVGVGGAATRLERQRLEELRLARERLRLERERTRLRAGLHKRYISFDERIRLGLPVVDTVPIVERPIIERPILGGPLYSRPYYHRPWYSRHRWHRRSEEEAAGYPPMSPGAPEPPHMAIKRRALEESMRAFEAEQQEGAPQEGLDPATAQEGSDPATAQEGQEAPAAPAAQEGWDPVAQEGSDPAAAPPVQQGSDPVGQEAAAPEAATAQEGDYAGMSDEHYEMAGFFTEW
ncbi:hypothetical protein AA313_de0208796 [Arthrobotrys entomopaga]|nr:hypothetical protein AA313_de0208796 [Arthrobotrys entomopaga]